MQLQSLLGFLGKSFSSGDGNAAKNADAGQPQTGFGAMLAAAFGLTPQPRVGSASGPASLTADPHVSDEVPPGGAQTDATPSVTDGKGPEQEAGAAPITPGSSPAPGTTLAPFTGELDPNQPLSHRPAEQPASTPDAEAAGEPTPRSRAAALSTASAPASSPAISGATDHDALAENEKHTGQNQSPSQPTRAGSGPSGTVGASAERGGHNDGTRLSTTGAADHPVPSDVDAADGRSEPSKPSAQIPDASTSLPSPETRSVEARPPVDQAAGSQPARPVSETDSSSPQSTGTKEGQAAPAGSHAPRTSADPSGFRASSASAGEQGDESGSRSARVLAADSDADVQSAAAHARQQAAQARGSEDSTLRSPADSVTTNHAAPKSQASGGSGTPPAPSPEARPPTSADSDLPADRRTPTTETGRPFRETPPSSSDTARQGSPAAQEEPGRAEAPRDRAESSRRDLSMASAASEHASFSGNGSGGFNSSTNQNWTASRDETFAPTLQSTAFEAVVDNLTPEELPSNVIQNSEEAAFSPEQTATATSTTPLDAAQPAARGRGIGATAWLRSMLMQSTRGMSLEQGWKTIEVQLEEGQGTMTVRARRSDDGLAISVSFSDPNVRSLAEANVQRLEDALRSEYESNVDLSLMSDGSADTPSNRDQPDADRPHRLGRPTAEPSAELSSTTARRAAAAGVRNEWIG